MDDKRFDCLTRALASGQSRRSIIKGFLGLGAAVAVSNAVVDPADARRSSISTTPPATTPAPTTSSPPPCAGTQCGFECCDSPDQCCDGECCALGDVCVGEELCCPSARACSSIASGCCPADQRCCSQGGTESCLGADLCCEDADCQDACLVCGTDGVCVPKCRRPQRNLLWRCMRLHHFRSRKLRRLRQSPVSPTKPASEERARPANRTSPRAAMVLSVAPVSVSSTAPPEISASLATSLSAQGRSVRIYSRTISTVAPVSTSVQTVSAAVPVSVRIAAVLVKPVWEGIAALRETTARKSTGKVSVPPASNREKSAGMPAARRMKFAAMADSTAHGWTTPRTAAPAEIHAARVRAAMQANAPAAFP